MYLSHVLFFNLNDFITHVHIPLKGLSSPKNSLKTLSASPWKTNGSVKSEQKFYAIIPFFIPESFNVQTYLHHHLEFLSLGLLHHICHKLPSVKL